MKKLLSLSIFCVFAAGLMVPMKAMEAEDTNHGVKRKRDLEDPAGKMNDIIEKYTKYTSDDKEEEKSYHLAGILREVNAYLNRVYESERNEMSKNYPSIHGLKYPIATYGSEMLLVLKDMATDGENENHLANVVRSHLRDNWKLEKRLKEAHEWSLNQRREFFNGSEQAWQDYAQRYGAQSKTQLGELLHEDWPIRYYNS